MNLIPEGTTMASLQAQINRLEKLLELVVSQIDDRFKRLED